MNLSSAPRRIGWLSVGTGLAGLTFLEPIVRGLSLRRSSLVRAVALRDVAIGLGLVTGARQRSWLFARLGGDVMDAALLAIGAVRSRRPLWTLGALGAAVCAAVDLHTLRASEAPVRVEPLGDTQAPVPLESWRGSGLAEDVGAPARAEHEEDEAARAARMREAQHQLGLQDPEVATRARRRD